MRTTAANPLIVALDVADLDRAVALAMALAGEVGWFKIGLELFSAHGPEAVRRVREVGPVFLDIKLHDIPTTVGRAARRCGELGIDMLTVHASGGAAMVEAAVDGLRATAPYAAVIAVTVLTSLGDDDLAAVNAPPAGTQVPHLALLAVRAEAAGVVCSPADVAIVRGVIGPDAIVVTPGIRLAETQTHDHARWATPDVAIAAGADRLVVGRPITAAEDPVTEARRLLAAARGKA